MRTRAQYLASIRKPTEEQIERAATNWLVSRQAAEAAWPLMTDVLIEQELTAQEQVA